MNRDLKSLVEFVMILSLILVTWIVLIVTTFPRPRAVPPLSFPPVVDGPAEPIFRRSTWCPPPELREPEPEPTLDLPYEVLGEPKEGAGPR